MQESVNTPKKPTLRPRGYYPAVPEPITSASTSKAYTSSTLSSAPISVPNASDALTTRKKLRTYLRDADGLLQDAQINLDSGEITPHAYAKPPGPLKFAVRAKESDIAPPWMRIPAPSTCERPLGPPSRKVLRNHIRPFVAQSLSLQEAIEEFPVLDNLFQGALHLDLGGNTRPLNPTMIFRILQHLELISAATVEEFMGCSRRHAQKIVQVLNVILVASKQASLAASFGAGETSEVH